jgi:glycosyltransferase involved in cell wall biosynthesis
MNKNIKISVLIVMRNEEKYIIDCIKSIESQFTKKDSWELILIDGMSEDKTKEIATNYLKTVDYDYQILNNPKKILASGWTIGIQKAKGKYVIRPDAHAVLHPNYIKYGIEVLKSKDDVTAVGGKLITKGKGFWGNIFKEALSSRVGVGDSSFRTDAKSGYYDTAVYAVYRREIFDKVGYFNENSPRHEDNDMHKRISDAGGKFYLDIRMVADYYARDTLPKLLQQMYANGRYSIDSLFDGALSIRHLAPFLFYMFIVLSILASLVFKPFLLLVKIVFGGYILVITLDTIKRLIQSKNFSILLNIFIIPIMHMSYGFGTLVGLIKKLFSH